LTPSTTTIELCSVNVSVTLVKSMENVGLPRIRVWRNRFGLNPPLPSPMRMPVK
jgi:hypothetical protein